MTECILPADLQRGWHGNDSMLEAMRDHVGDHCQHHWANSIAAGYNDLWDELESKADAGLILLGRLVDAVCELCDAVQRAHTEQIEAEQEVGVQGRLLRRRCIMVAKNWTGSNSVHRGKTTWQVLVVPRSYQELSDSCDCLCAAISEYRRPLVTVREWGGCSGFTALRSQRTMGGWPIHPVGRKGHRPAGGQA